MSRLKHLQGQIMSFSIDGLISRWWKDESATAKASFFYSLIIGFLSHLFVYTGRYYARDDMGMIRGSFPGGVMGGRWFAGFIQYVFTDNYMLPLVSGLFTSFFLAASAFFVCKLFTVNSKVNAVLIGLLLVTFPSIADSNLYALDITYHFAVFLAVVAVYVTVRYKYGFIGGGILSMLTLASYQAQFNVVTALCLFYLIAEILSGKRFNEYKITILKLFLLVVLGGGLYAISLPVTMNYFNAGFNSYRGFDPDSLVSRFLSPKEFVTAIERTYIGFYEGFYYDNFSAFGGLKYIYAIAAVLTVINSSIIIVQQRIRPFNLVFIIILLILVPLACNFAGFFETLGAHGLMIYACVYLPVFAVVLLELCKNNIPLLRSFFYLCVVFTIISYVTICNIFYLMAYHSNQKTYSQNIRIIDKMEPLLPLTTSNKVTVFGAYPNEYMLTDREFGEFYTVGVGFADFIHNYMYQPHWITKFGNDIRNNHGIILSMLADGDERDRLSVEVLNLNMPAWPAEGSVDIINDVIVVNFGITDVIYETDETGQYFLARHWISEGHAEHNYEYEWDVYINGEHVHSFITNTNRLDFSMPDSEDEYIVTLIVKNIEVGFSYPRTSYELLKNGNIGK